jgi:eukaryotic-like serine/threonine-protein kinase
MTLLPGSKLGPYEIQSPLGAGGMGEVYRARDTRLERTVAIKILPAQFTSDPISKQRFEREAKAISSLNHPHICTLYDIGHQDGTDYIVMECVEGETLAKRLEKGPLPQEQGLRVAAQIAEALDKAHRSGIAHRDLKPGNIMLTATGAKLLDFGLAKELAPLANLATLTTALPTSPVTQQGTIVGTFQYMSPEQVEGKEVDGRSDIFSLGAVLYEMLTGKRAFEGKTQLSVASAILEREPEPLSDAKPTTPPALEHAIRRCLAKDPEERWQTGRDLAIQLKWIGDSGSQFAAPSRERAAEGHSSRVSVGLAGMLCAGALAAGILAGTMWWRSSKPPEQAMHFSAPLPFAARDMAAAPNGHTLAVVGYQETARKNVIWLYEVGAREAKNLSDTEGADFPFWSPDGKFLGFFADGKLKKLEVAGGTVQTLCDAPSGRGGTWNKDGVIIFTPSGHLFDGLYRISASGGTPTRISSPDTSRGENSHRWPMFLPDGRHYLYLGANVVAPNASDGIFLGALDSNEKRLVVKTDANAAYSASGYLVFSKENTLLAQRFDLKKFELAGEPVAIMTDVQYLPRIARAVFAVSDTMLFAQRSGEVSRSRLAWFDRKGNEVGAVGNPDVYSNLILAPDGKSVAVDKTDIASQNTDVWTYELQHDRAKRLTFDPAMDAMPIWSPDGALMLFASTRQHAFDLYLKDADGAREEKLILHNEIDKLPNDWSRDGKYVLYTQGADFWYLSYPDLKAILFLKAPSTVKNGQFAPDGKWVAYASNESGKWEIYVTSFPEARGKWEVSSGGGEQPRWRSDGKELFYLSPTGKMMAVPVKTGTGFDAGTPEALFQANPREILATSELVTYDVDRSGQRFLINTQVKRADTQPISVVLNWDAGLKK